MQVTYGQVLQWYVSFYCFDDVASDAIASAIQCLVQQGWTRHEFEKARIGWAYGWYEPEVVGWALDKYCPPHDTGGIVNEMVEVVVFHTDDLNRENPINYLYGVDTDTALSLAQVLYPTGFAYTANPVELISSTS